MCFGDGAELDNPYARSSRFEGDGAGAEYRRHLLLCNRERIEFSYEKARSHGLEGPVILVLDLSDHRAVCMSRMAGASWEQIERSREDCRSLDVVPVHVISVPPCAALYIIGPSTPNSRLGIVKPSPPGTFRVVAIAAGGNSFADFPLPPVTELGDE